MQTVLKQNLKSLHLQKLWCCGTNLCATSFPRKSFFLQISISQHNRPFKYTVITNFLRM